MADKILDITPVTFIPSQRTTHSDVITVTNTFIINYDFAHVDPTSANVAKIGGGGGGTGRRSSGRVKPLTSRKKHLLLLREQQAFMARLDQIRNHRIEIENWAADMIQQVMRAFLERKRERPETDEGEVKLDTETKTKDVTRNNEKQNNQRFFATLRQRFALMADVQAGVKNLIAKSEEIMQRKLQESTLAGVPQWKRKALLKQKQRSDKRKRKALKNRVGTRVQAIMRGWMARRAFRLLVKMNMDEKMTMAATKIQSQARVFTTKQSLKAVLEKHVHCATDIQRVYRGWETREFVNYIRDELRHRMKRLEATVAIQTMFRGFQAKGKVQDIRTAKAAMVLQCAFRSHQAREEMAEKKLVHDQAEKKKQKELTEAALKIQNVSRSRKANKEAKKRKSALIKIQRSERGRAARKRVKNAKAAKKIQAAQRGRRERQKQKQQHKKATRIQAQVRRRLSTKRVEQIQKDQEQEVAARKEQEVAAGEQQVVEAGEEQAVYAMQEQNVEGGDEQVGEEGEKQVGEGGDEQVGEGGEEPVQVEEKPLIEDGEEKVGDVDQEQVVEGGEEQEDAEVPSKAIETEAKTETETETVAVDDTPSAEEIAAATKLQRVARGSQARDRVDELRAERRRQLSAEAGETGQRKVKRKKK